MSVEVLNQLYCCIAQLYRVFYEKSFFYNILAVFADKMTKMTKNRLVWTRMTKKRLVWIRMTKKSFSLDQNDQKSFSLDQNDQKSLSLDHNDRNSQPYTGSGKYIFRYQYRNVKFSSSYFFNQNIYMAFANFRMATL